MSADGCVKTILLAEDHDALRRFVLGILINDGYNVIVAVNGQDALQKARDHKGDIHLLLSDVEMPALKGPALAAQLQIERPNMKVLLISGTATGTVASTPGWQFLPKPFVGSTLRSNLALMLNQEGL